MTGPSSTAIADGKTDALPMQCKSCKHEWAEPLALPMEVSLFSKRLKRTHCPKCDAPSKELQINFARKA